MSALPGPALPESGPPGTEPPELRTASVSGDPVIRLEDVSKTYAMGGSTVYALDRLSLEVTRGSFWAVMGPSGSGKSTLLNILGCMDRPSGGRYLLEGVDVSALDDDALSGERLSRLGFIFQSFNLIPQLSVRENIELPLFYRGLSAVESALRAAELAEQVGLSDRLVHRPTELSGGERQRVAIARALANDPSVILADEPTGNLDSHTGAQIMELLSNLHREGRTIIMVTHENEVASHARFRLHLRDGRIERMEGSAS